MESSQWKCTAHMVMVNGMKRAWARARLPGSNEYVSFRLKTVWQQCLKICNRKGED